MFWLNSSYKITNQTLLTKTKKVEIMLYLLYYKVKTVIQSNLFDFVISRSFLQVRLACNLKGGELKMYTASDIATWLLTTNYIDCSLNEEVDRITNLKLQKLLYYAQGIYLSLHEDTLFEDRIEAWKHGPVIREVYRKYSVNGSNPIFFKPTKESRELVDEIDSDENAYKVLRFTYEEFGQYTAWALRNMTHQERPWKETPLDDVIDNNLIMEFFKEEIVDN